MPDAGSPALNVVGWPVALASLSLIALSLGLARLVGLKIERELVGASVRAALQLVAVGLVFSSIFDSAGALYWAWLWVGGMSVVAVSVVVRRAHHRIAGLAWVTAAAVVGSVVVSTGVTFGFGVVEYGPVSLVVIAGLTIGNAVPSAVLGVNQSLASCRERLGETEALLSLGFDRKQVVRFLAPRVARSSLITQIERTRVVGLIALPGAMAGMLLAGADPLDSVIVQLLVMYLVLGTAAVCVVLVIAVVMRASVTRFLQPADWVRPGTVDRDDSGDHAD
ncbi:MAG: ABC transporter permease [Acidimicrobiia bacterium]|nr:ABC transporter permease [Acidimicrobiia bacterium]